MFPDGPESLSNLDVTLTSTTYVVGLVASLAVQFIKAIISRWPSVRPEIKKPLLPLIGIVLCCLTLAVAGVENWFVAGVVIGLASGGGYDIFKGTSNLSKPKPLHSPH